MAETNLTPEQQAALDEAEAKRKAQEAETAAKASQSQDSDSSQGSGSSDSSTDGDKPQRKLTGAAARSNKAKQARLDAAQQAADKRDKATEAKDEADLAARLAAAEARAALAEAELERVHAQEFEANPGRQVDQWPPAGSEALNPSSAYTFKTHVHPLTGTVTAVVKTAPER